MKVTDTLWTSTESLLTSNDSRRSSNDSLLTSTDSLLTSTDSLLTSTDYTGFVKDCISFKPASCVTDRFLSLGCPDLSTFSLMYFLATSTTSVPKALRPASSLSGLSLGRGKNDLFIGRQTCHSSYQVSESLLACRAPASPSSPPPTPPPWSAQSLTSLLCPSIPSLPSP